MSIKQAKWICYYLYYVWWDKKQKEKKMMPSNQVHSPYKVKCALDATDSVSV